MNRLLTLKEVATSILKDIERHAREAKLNKRERMKFYEAIARWFMGPRR